MIFVYISEAHAYDEWRLGSSVVVNAHKTLEDRIAAAKRFQERYNLRIPILCDSMDDTFDATYSAWPDRYFLIDKSQKLQIVGDNPNKYGIHRGRIMKWIAHCLDPLIVDKIEPPNEYHRDPNLLLELQQIKASFLSGVLDDTPVTD